MSNDWISPRKQKAESDKFCQDSCIRGYHAYNEIWTEVLGEVTLTERELFYIADHIAVAVKKHCGEIVKHLLHYAACL